MSNAQIPTVGGQRALSPGRPRDPGVDDRITSAALLVFGEAGWSGFNFDVVARRAAVGKAGLYLRWQNREDLLSDAIEQRLASVEEVDTGSLRGDLVELGRQLMDRYLGEYGGALLRLNVEARSMPAIDDRYRAWKRSQVAAGRALVRRGIERGDLPADASVTLVLDTFCGAVQIHVSSTPDELRARMREQSELYLVELADFVLRAAAG